jgi:hypothetical protein
VNNCTEEILEFLRKHPEQCNFLRELFRISPENKLEQISKHVERYFLEMFRVTKCPIITYAMELDLSEVDWNQIVEILHLESLID